MIQEMFEYYWFTIAVAAFFSVILSYLGVHLVNQGRSLILFPQAQMSVLAILIGIIFSDGEPTLIILFSACSLTIIAGYFLQKIKSKVLVKGSEWMIAIYLLMLSFSDWLTRYFPVLEAHSHQGFHGDIITAEDSNLRFCLLLSLCLMIIFFIRKFKDREQSFEVSIGNDKDDLIFNIMTSVILTMGIFLMGFVYTISYLLLPSLLISSLSKSYGGHILLTGLLAFCSSAFGFSLSIILSDLSTTPTMILSLLVFFFLVKGVSLARQWF